MTLAMPDSTDVAALPGGCPAYLGYTDGEFANTGQIRKRFPAARVIGLTVTGTDISGADGCDIEPGNLTAKDGAQWARQKLNRQPASRPVMYASVIGEPGYGMSEVISALHVNMISISQVRLLSAHYGEGEHICGPHTCNLINIGMDGTQWTDQFRSQGLFMVDMSALQDGFFGSWTEEIVQQLPVVQQGDTGDSVRTVQGLVNARLARSSPDPYLLLDGIFGTKTKTGVEIVQGGAKITQDGVVGPLTWPVLLGIA